MPEKAFKARLHDVIVDDVAITALSDDAFELAIETVGALDLSARWMELRDRPRRLENYEKRGRLHLMNFMTAEFAGPGKTGDSTPVAPMGLESNEYYAHETAALYDPQQGIVLLESGVGGMGPGAIKMYFRNFANRCDVTLSPRVDGDASVRARRFQQFRSLQLRVSMGPATARDTEMGTGTLQGLGKHFHAQQIDVIVKAGRTKSDSLAINMIRSVIDNVVNRRDETHIQGCKVYGHEHEDDPYELIDLIAQPIKNEWRLPIDPDTRKVSHNHKWDALVKIHGEITP